MNDPITIDVLRTHAFARLAASSRLVAWAATHYPARKLLVTDGADAASQAEFDVIPAISLFNGDEGDDPASGDHRFAIIAECRIREPGGSVAAGPGDLATRVYAWPALSAALARLIRAELRDAFADTNAPVDSWAIAYNHRDAWPVVLASVTINFRIPGIIGGEISWNPGETA